MSTASPDRDVIDAIDELVDAQLQQTPSGYDHNINQAKCPHAWCDADWHGLPVKTRMNEMRRYGRVDLGYVYGDDESQILCPGSTFDGEFTPPASESDPIRRGHRMIAQTGDQIAALLGIPPLDDLFGASSLLMPNSPNSGGWQPLTGSGGVLAHGPQWWRCDDVHRHGIRLDTDRYREVSYAVPGRVMFPAGTFVTAGDEQILLRPDHEAGASGVSGFDRETGDEWMEIHCETPPVIGDWYLRDETAILDLAQVRQLEQVIVCLTVAEEVDAGRRDHLNEEMARAFGREARAHFPGARIDSRDLVYRWGERDRLRDTRVIEVHWRQPRSEQVELRGGPGNGHTREAGDLRAFDRINVLNPVRITSFREPVEPTAQISTTSYQHAGFNTVTRRPMFRPVYGTADLTDSLGWQALRSGVWQGIGTVERNSVQFTPTDEGCDIQTWGQRDPIRTDVTRELSFSIDIPESSVNAWRALAETVNEAIAPPARHIIIASRQADARRYARQRHITRPIIVDLERSHPEDVLRGLNLDESRIHEIAGGLVPARIMEHLRMLAAHAGRPLESFYATTDTEQAA